MPISMHSILNFAVLHFLISLSEHSSLGVIKFVNALNFTSISRNEFSFSTNIEVIVPLLRHSSSMCVVSRNYDILVKFSSTLLFQNAFKAQTLLQIGRPVPSSCDHTVFLDVSIADWSLGVVMERSKSRYLFVNDALCPDAAELLKAAARMRVVVLEVVSVCLRDGSVFRFSPQYQQFENITADKTDFNHLQESRNIPNLGGTVLTVAAEINPPIMIFGTDIDEPDGIDVKMIYEMSRQLNFTVKLETTSHWSNETDGGKLILKIVRGEFEIMISNVLHIHITSKFCDLGPSINMLKLVAIVRRPETTTFGLSSFFEIYQLEVWLWTLPTLFFVVVTYSLSLSLDLKLFARNFPSGVMAVLGFFTGTSFSLHGNKTVTRVIFTFWSLFTLVFTTTLTTGIVSRLTLPLYTPRVDTIQQLVEQGYYWTVPFYTEREPRNTTSRLFPAEYQTKLVEKYVYIKPEERLKRASTDPKIVFLRFMHGDIALTDGTMSTWNKVLRGFRKLRENIRGTQTTFCVRRKSPLLEPLSVISLRLQEAGMRKHWTDEVLRRWPQYNTRHLLEERDLPTFREATPLRLRKLQPIFFMLCIGLAVAFVAFICELVVSVIFDALRLQ